MDKELVALLGKLFVERRDVYAIQGGNGAYRPAEDRQHKRLPFNAKVMRAHLEGKTTVGHYLLSPENKCRLFAFDIDLVKGLPNPDEPTKWLPVTWDGPEGPTEFWPREAFQDKEHFARPVLISQLNAMAEGLARRVHRLLEIPVAAAFSGNKGVHVYGFTGSLLAEEVREAAHLVLDSYGVFKKSRGDNFWQHVDAYEVLEIEVFPKQDKLDNPDSLGNLMRMPLGINQKTKLPGHFLKFQSPLTEFTEMDPMEALNGAPWCPNPS